MTKEAIRMKIVKLTETDWKKYPTYEHMIEEWVTEIIDEVTKEHNSEVKILKEEIELWKKASENNSYKASQFEDKIKELREDLEVAEIWNKSLNAMNKELESNRDKYRNMVFDLQEQIEKAKELLIGFISKMKNSVYTPYEKDLVERAEQFLKELAE